ncbi:DUF1003 domain-containing protein [Sphingomonas sp. SORGH_AS_0879]|uniref:DUF1003 domain-containing protein n=1 Tax=Sphingomonas sp. SORGH_AS_0879 TaxID=3041790 RepID=UPI00277F4BF7|nr:DUF1003 domain-containing protein [Sphingomonas sp. SORGH_AS_0879]MDQ1232194.1 putative membrane protein [Sphingomonas sp. SORGH_AS_0879]
MALSTAAEIARRTLGKPAHELDEEEAQVIADIESGQLSARDAADVADETSTWGEKLADRVAAVGGSWGFIIAFSVILLGWMLLNSDVLGHFGLVFDPYPYIFLNLMLSTLAAIQAPVIMMSQNRQSAKDRLAASLDYRTNLRAEIDILRLHHKLDNVVTERLDSLEAKIDGLANALARS